MAFIHVLYFLDIALLQPVQEIAEDGFLDWFIKIEWLAMKPHEDYVQYACYSYDIIKKHRLTYKGKCTVFNCDGLVKKTIYNNRLN